MAVAILAGIAVLFLAAATEGPTSLINYVPLAAHVVLDYVLAGLLIAMPFIAGFLGRDRAHRLLHRARRAAPPGHDRNPVQEARRAEPTAPQPRLAREPSDPPSRSAR